MSRGALAAERMLGRAHELLVTIGSPAVEVGFLHLKAVLRCPAGPEPVLVDERDLAALAELEAVPAC